MNTFQHAPLVSTKQLGDAAEDQALTHLQDRGLQLLARNYRTPGRGGVPQLFGADQRCMLKGVH